MSNQLLDTSNDVFISKDGPTVAGIVDEVKIYNYARTPAQIAWDYNRGEPSGHWSFNECSGTDIHDGTDNGNDGTLQLGSLGVTSAGSCGESGTTFWYNGKDGHANSAGSFDGSDDYVDCGDDLFETHSQGTISAWIKRDGNGDGNAQDIFSASNTNDLFNLQLSDYGTNDWRLRVYSKNNPDAVQGATSIDTSWHHVVLTSDGSSYKIYLDGVEESITATTGANSGDWFAENDSGTDSYLIGARTAAIGDPSYFDGLIDEVKVWSYPLTAQLVKKDFNSGAVRFQ